jgi:hypothetical protein
MSFNYIQLFLSALPPDPLSNQLHIMKFEDNLIGEGEDFLRGAGAPLRRLLPLWGEENKATG